MTGTHNEIDEMFARVRADGRTALVPYLTAGFPSPEGFVDLASAILESGADALEIGIPFSDPLLDGPSIQHSQQTALAAGVRTQECLDFAREIRRCTDKPLLFMGAYNPLVAFGVATFCAAAHDAGISALLVPDVPLEEQGEVQEAAGAHHLHLIQFVAPTSTADRLERVCSAASGFLYCISVTGITGARAGVADTARPLVERVRKYTDLPVAVGFGIAGPEQAREVARFADGVIVGSALVTLVGEANESERIGRTRQFIANLASALQVAPFESR